MNLASLANLLILIGLMAIMLSMGLKVTFEEVGASIRKPRLVVLGLVANYLLIPAVILGLLRAFDAGAMVSVGFLILAVCPGAPLGPPFAVIARGDVPSAIGQMVILAGLSALLSPALLGLVMMWLLPENDLHVDYLAIVRVLLVAQILPLGVGLALRQWAPKLSRWIDLPVRVAANLLLISAIVLVLFTEHGTFGTIKLQGWLGMLLLLAACLGIGWLCGGPGIATRKSTAVTAGIRNVAVGLIIASKNFAGTPAMTAVIAYAFVSILGTLICALLFAALPTTAAAK
jgi:BASS family bile acid:Na+ symporter